VFLPDTGAQNGREVAYCMVEDTDSLRQVRFRGDPRIWEWAGLYEHLVRRLLRGNSPAALSHLLQRALQRHGESIESLRAVLLNAGNGWLAEELRQVGVGEIVGVDASAAAAAAAERDHPESHNEYLVIDMRRLSEAQRDYLMEFDFNCLVTVDPLGSDEPAPNAFTEAFNLLAPEGWVALHLAEDGAATDADSRFARLVQHMIASGALKLETRERYRHRFTTHGTPLFHVAVVGRKVRDFDPGEAA
jgi:hypothetical protein